MLLNWLRKKQTPAAEAPLPTTAEVPVDTSEDDESEEEYEDEEDEEDEEFEEEEDVDDIVQRVYEWAREWSETPLFAALSQEQKEESEFIVTSFTEYMYNYQGVAPESWDVYEMEECCVETLPRKISSEDAYFRSLAPVLSSFFTFLHQVGRLPRAAKLASRIRTLDKRIINAAADPYNWGMAKSFVMAAKAAGVDLDDQGQMNRFMMQYNAQMASQNMQWPDMRIAAIPPTESEPLVTTFERSGPKVGRNDPCPCGSGKKYKKCCGG